jgi:hypothetical protein
MLRVTLLTYAPLAVLMAGSASAQTTLMVPATATIFAAGQSVVFSGTLPPVVTLPPVPSKPSRLYQSGRSPSARASLTRVPPALHSQAGPT